MVNLPLACLDYARKRCIALMLPFSFAAGMVTTLLWGLGGFSTAWATSSASAVITVTTTNDELNTDGDCSLREAVQAANTDQAVDACAAGSGADSILLPAGIYTLTLAGAGEDNNATGDLDIIDAVTIRGVDPATTIIDANGLDRALHLLADNATLTLTKLTVRHGQLPLDSGAGLYASGPVVLSNTIFSGNASASGSGGGAYFARSAVISGSLFLSNTARFGGGAYFYESATITKSTFLSNTASSGGGGAHFESELVPSKVTVVGTTFQGNRVGDAAAGFMRTTVTHRPTGTSETCQSTIGGGGAVFDGSASIIGTTFADNAAPCGGGAYFYSEYFNTNLVTVTSTVFVNNSAAAGGGVYYYGSGVNTNNFVNTLFAANEAVEDQGSALFSDSAGGDDVIILRHATIASPTVGSGSAIYVLSGTVHITNTIIASYTIGLERAGGALSEDYNLFFGTTSPISGSVTSGGNGVLWGDPAFANPAGADYHLTLGSPAIDMGTNAGVTSDFENDVRPQGHGYDIGYDESPFTHIPISGLSVTNSSPTMVSKATLFTATLTTGSGVRYQWNFGDGSGRDGSSSAVSHTYGKAGNYTAIVTATNSLGSMSAATSVVIKKSNIYLPILTLSK